jgi:hypothetical protein
MGGRDVSEKNRWAGFFVIFLIVVSLPLGAVEPEGFFRLRTTWIEAGVPVAYQPGTAERSTRLEIAPVTGVDSSRITILVPEVVALRFEPSWAEVVEEMPPQDGRRSYRLVLGTLPAGAPVRIDLEFRPPADGGGIVSFLVEGTTVDGRPVRDAAGWSVGHPGPRPVLRHGAVEYPLVPAPETPR